MEIHMRTAKQPRAIKTRDRILREAAQLFALKGFHDTKVDEIIKAAEVTSGAFFHHFKGKEDLGFAVIDHHMEERCRALDRIEKILPTDGNNDPLDRVFRRLDAVCEMVVRRRNRKGGCLIGNLSTALSDTHPAFRKRLGECFDEMASEFRVHLDEAAANHGLSGDQDTGEMARYIVSVIEGAIMLTRTHRDVNVIERQVHHLKEDVKRSFQTTDQLKGAMSR
jgi:TetR/AcrR family transcriptional repressor of nem operon